MKEEKENDSAVSVSQVGSDLNILEKFVRLHPLLEPKIVKAEMIKQNQTFKKYQIVKIIQEVRNEIFPRDEEKVFTTHYCQASDTQDQGLNLFRGHIKISFLSSVTMKISPPQEAIILTNKTMLKQMASSFQWFLDATFKVAPRGFQQILNIIVYLPNLKIFYPVSHIIMTHKTQELYWHAIQHLKITAEFLGFNLTPTLIMGDFEPALRGACQKIFPDVQFAGCYFHFVKALNDKMKKLGLCKKLLKNKAKLLISFLQIIAHCPKEQRKEFFDEITDIYKGEDSKFKEFLVYFKKNWLANTFMDNLFEAMQNESELEFIRTNNPCEVFHKFLSKVSFNLILIF